MQMRLDRSLALNVLQVGMINMHDKIYYGRVRYDIMIS